MFSSLRNSLEHRYLVEQGFGSGKEFAAQLVSGLAAGDLVLDAGCGEGGLKALLPRGVFYIGLDRYVGTQSNEYSDWQMRPSVLGDVHHLPIATGVCKAVALMHVLEHAHNPISAMRELARVLQPGGRLFVDVPFMHEIHHAPHDYFRYTPFALEGLASDAGLVVEEIRPSGGYFRLAAHILEAAPSMISRSTPVGLLLNILLGHSLKFVGFVLRKLQYPLDLYDGSKTMTCGFHCIFRKEDRE